MKTNMKTVMKIDKSGRKIACYLLALIIIASMAAPQNIPVYADPTPTKTFEVELGEPVKSGNGNNVNVTFPDADITATTSGTENVYALVVSVDKGSVKTSNLNDVNYLTDNQTDNHQTVTFYWNSGETISNVEELLKTISFKYEREMSVTVTVDGNYTYFPSNSGQITTYTPKTVDGSANIDGTTHYYIHVENNSIKWNAAYDKAKSYYLMGMRGYLVTITELGEDITLDKISTDGAWAGGLRQLETRTNFDLESADGYTEPASAEGTCWFWVDGPESGLKIPNEGSTDSSKTQERYKVSEVKISDEKAVGYSNWRRATGTNQEPNNHKNGSNPPCEYCLQIHYPGETTVAQHSSEGAIYGWNDLYHDKSYNSEACKGFFVEFSQYSGGMDSNYTDIKTTTVTRAVDHVHTWVASADVPDGVNGVFTVECSGCHKKHTATVFTRNIDYSDSDYSGCVCDEIAEKLNGNSDGVTGYGYELEYYVKNDAGEYVEFSSVNNNSKHDAPYMAGDENKYRVKIKLTKDGNVCKDTEDNDVEVELPVVINPSSLWITAKEQDIAAGEPLKTGVDWVDVNFNAPGDRVTYVEIVKVTNGGKNEAQPQSAKVVNSAGEDVTYCYNIAYMNKEYKTHKKTPHISNTSALKCSDITYGQKLADSTFYDGKVVYTTASGTDVEVKGTWNWKSSANNPDIIMPNVVNDSEKTEYTAVFTPEESDIYEQIEKKLTVKVKPKEIRLKWENTEFTYDGTEHIPTATPQGVLTGDENTINVTVMGGETDANHGTTATSYTATAALSGNDNYILAEDDKEQSFVINPAELNIYLKNQDSVKKQPLTYTGVNAIDASKTTGLVTGDEIAAISVEKGTESGVSKVVYVPNTAKIKKGVNEITFNYNISVHSGNLNDDKITLTEADIISTSKPSAPAITYGMPLSGSIINPGTVVHDGETIEGNWIWEKVAGKDPNEVFPGVKEAGSEDEYVVRFEPKGGYADDYYSFTTKLTLKVNPKPIELIWSEFEFTYDGDEHAPKAELESGQIKAGDENKVHVTVTGKKTDANNGTTTGTNYTATAELDNNNYSIKDGFESHSFVINPKPLKIYLKEQVLVKNQQLPQGPSNTVEKEEGLVGTDFISDIKIKKDTSTATPQVVYDEGTARIGRPKGTDTEDITYNYIITVVPGKLIENKITLTDENVKTPPTASDITYGEPLSDSIVSGGVIEDDKGNIIEGTWTWKKVDINGVVTEPSDVYPEVFDNGSEENYIAIFSPGPSFEDDYTKLEYPVTLKVMPKEVEITWNEDSFAYDGNPHKPTATVTAGKVGNDIVNVVVDNTYAQTEVGNDYEAIGTLDNKNYKIKSGNEKHSFAITPKSIKDPSIEITITYDPNDETKLIIEIVDKKTGQTLEKDIDYSVDINSNAGDDFSNVTITGLGNYSGEYKTTVKNQKWTGSVLSVVTVDDDAREFKPKMTSVTEESAIAILLNEIDKADAQPDDKSTAIDIINEIKNDPRHESNSGSYRAVITLAIRNLKEEEVPNGDVAEVKGIIGKQGIPGQANVCQYFDISLWVQYVVQQINPTTKTLVSDKRQIFDTTDSKLRENSFEEEITITVPEELRPQKGYSRTYYFVRVHHLANGTTVETEPLPVQRNGYELTIKTDKFSTYALLYTDTKDPEKPKPDGPKPKPDAPDNSTPNTPDGKPAPTKVTAPKTSDTADIFVSYGMIFMGLMLLLVCYLINRKFDKRYDRRLDEKT